MKNYILKDLKRKRDGVVMINVKNNIEVKCTEKYVKFWEQLGFEVVEYKQISLVS